MIKAKNVQKRVIIEQELIWILDSILDVEKKTSVGKYAIITNSGIILQKGCILLNGNYIANDDDLPNVNQPDGHIREFKELFCNDGGILDNFEFNFCTILENNNVNEIWTYINKLSKKTKIKIHSIINLHHNSYGICLNNKSKKKIGNHGIIFVVNKSFFILDSNGKKMII